MQTFTGLEGKTQDPDGLRRRGDAAPGSGPALRQPHGRLLRPFRRRLALGWHRRLGPGPARPPRCASTATRSPQGYCGKRRRLRAWRSGAHGGYGAAGEPRRPTGLAGGGKGNWRGPGRQGRCCPEGPQGHGAPPPGRRRRLGAPGPPHTLPSPPRHT